MTHAQAIGLDKTGTLTTGHFELLRLEPLPGAAHTRQVLHRWVAAVEDQDNHPLARSLVASYKGCVADFVASGESLPATSGYQRHGRDGVSATVEGRRVGVGNLAFLEAALRSSQADDDDDDDDDDESEMPPRMRAALRRRREQEKAAAAAGKGEHAGEPLPAAVAAADPRWVDRQTRAFKPPLWRRRAQRYSAALCCLRRIRGLRTHAVLRVHHEAVSTP